MKIVFVTELTHSGGVDTFLGSLIEHWPNSDDEMIILANASHPGLAALARRLGARAHVGSHGVPAYVDNVIRRESGGHSSSRLLAAAQRTFLAVRGFFGFRHVFRRLAPDRVVVVAGGYPGGDSCRIAALAWKTVACGRPSATYNFHNLASPSSSWNLLEIIADIAVARSVAGVVAVSQACANSLRIRPRLWEAVPVGYILNGIVGPSRAEREVSVRTELGLAPDCPLVVMLATYERRKGHELLLNAFARVVKQIPEARLVVCGFGYSSEICRVESAVAELGLGAAVKLTGFRGDAYRILAAANVVAVPTQAYESFGLVAAEAMSLGIPVVATRVGGLPEVVEDGCGGYLVEPEDAAGFAARILDLLTDAELGESQGRMGRERYLRLFTADRMARDYAECIFGGVMQQSNQQLH